MPKRIAVGDGLDHVRDALKAQGFEVTKITSGTMSHVDCAVISGMSENFMGIHDTQGNKCPVINASGMTAREIVDTVQHRVGQ